MANRSTARLELRVGVGELLQPLGEPRQGDLLVTPALLELLDPAVGEVHAGQAKARSSRSFCSAVCRLTVPTDGDDDASRVIGSTWASTSGHTLSG